MGKSLFSITEVEAKTAKPMAVNSIIKDVLKANDEKAWADIERYLMPPGVSGSRQFDQAYAVKSLLDADAETGGRIAIVMESTGMSRRMLWDRLHAVLKSVGFRMSHGRLLGGMDENVDTSENGQPDVE